MPSFTERGLTRDECLKKIEMLYGSSVRILEEKAVWKKGGFLGLGGHHEVEMTGTYGRLLPNIPLPAVPEAAGLESAKRQILAAAGKTMPDAALQNVLKELGKLGASVESLAARMDNLGGTPVSAPVSGNHPSLLKLEDDLIQNDFSPLFTKNILERVRREFPLDELDDYEAVQKKVVLWIGESISIYREPEQPQGKKRPRVIVLVGPTGVGKTTTLIKLAALYGERERTEGIWQKQVRLVTLDCYRIGGESQIEKYGEIMEIPVSTVENHDGLKQVLALYRQDVDFILVDTIGKSPRSYGELGEMKAVLDACPPKTEIHLCIAASTKSSDIREILKQFEPFKYKSVIVTKLDETVRVGNMISILSEERKSISFITTGQGVPWHMERAGVMKLLLDLEGFAVDRLALVDHFRTRQTTLPETTERGV